LLGGCSVASLVTDILGRYSLLLKGASQSSDPLLASYADFVVLEQQTIASEETRKYWLEQLSFANGSRITGSSLLRQQSGSPRVGRIDVPIANQTSNRLHQLAAAQIGRASCR